MLQAEALIPDRGDVAVEHASVQDGAMLHALEPKDAGDLDNRLDIVGGVKEGEALGQDGQEDDAGGPDVDFGGLGGAFKEDLGGAKASRAGAVGAAGGAVVIFGVAGWRGLGGGFGEFNFGAAGRGRVLTEAMA